MKKTLLILVAALLTSLVTSAQVTDTIVSLTPSNRNVVLEEFTGIYCQYCPDGHKRANELKDAHPDRVNIINVHEGYYADNNYTTAFGTAFTGLAITCTIVLPLMLLTFLNNSRIANTSYRIIGLTVSRHLLALSAIWNITFITSNRAGIFTIFCNRTIGNVQTASYAIVGIPL